MIRLGPGRPCRFAPRNLLRVPRKGQPSSSRPNSPEAAGLPSDQWSWSYQSAGRSPELWLGPQLWEYIPKLAARGIKNIVVIPIGFVSDHVEILYDIDIQAQSVANEYGVRLERPPALNADPLFIDTLKDLIHERAARWLSG